jgi:Domain of unknown function (DUF4465)/Secretion system C-terminal sorting domain
MKKLKILTAAAILLCFFQWHNLNAQTVATFDNLTLAVDTFWNGSDMSGGFSDGGYFFPNSYTSYGGTAYVWSGFAYSNKIDTITTGLPNQFSAIAGRGYNNSSNYAVCSVLADWISYKPIPNIIKLNPAKVINGLYVTNNTYAYLSMLNGDSYAKKFGGTTGNDPDWFMLKIQGYHSGVISDSVLFYLADYRYANNSLDYIVKDWKWCDLSSLGTVDSLAFTLYSSDTGAYGMNTPSYFCIDNFNGNAPTNGISQLKEEQIIMNVFPNPCLDNINIIINERTSGKISLTDITGKEIKSIENFKGGIINLSNIQSGIYFITYSTPKGSLVKKISKK